MSRSWTVVGWLCLSGLGLLVLAGGCARPAAPAPAVPPSASTSSPAAPDDLPPPESEPPPPAPGPCAAGGRLWDGKPVDCSYEHGGCCYGSAASACAAAGCEEGRCQVLESYPAQVRCVGPAEAPQP